MQTRCQQKMPKLQGFGGSNSPNPAIGGLGFYGPRIPIIGAYQPVS